MVLFLFYHASSLVGLGYFLGNWNTEIKFFKIFHKTDRNFVFSHTTFDRMGELLRALLLIFLFIGYPADCVRTRRKQKACNTVRRCHDLQCCISTGIYQNLHHIKLIRCKVFSLLCVGSIQVVLVYSKKVHGGVLEIGSLMFIIESAGYRNTSPERTEKCLPFLSDDDLNFFQETFLQKMRSSGSKAEKEKYRCWLRIVYSVGRYMICTLWFVNAIISKPQKFDHAMSKNRWKSIETSNQTKFIQYKQGHMSNGYNK